MAEEAKSEVLARATSTSPQAGTEALQPSRDEGRRESERLSSVMDDMDEEPVADGRDDELPVRPHLTDDAGSDLGAALGLPPLDDGNVRLCRNAILLSLNEALLLGVRRVFYSRDRNHYSNKKDTRPSWWTYANVMNAAETMSDASNILIHHRALPQSPRATNFSPRRSSFEAGERFPLPSGPLPARESPVPSERVILRDKRGRAKPMKRSKFVAETCSFLDRYDDQIGKAELAIDNPDIEWLAPSLGFVRSSGRRVGIDLGRRYPVRIFNGKMSSGGRLYRMFWVEMPKRLRPYLRINGEPVEEHDFTACHLRLAYYALDAASACEELANCDPYVLPGYDESWRKIIKRGVQILLNAKTLREAQGALAKRIEADDWETRLDLADALIAAIKQAHPTLAPIWHSGCGLALQFVDSEIVKSCLEQLMDQGIVALPVHDAIIVPESQLHVLIEVMETTFRNLGQRLAPATVAALLPKPGFCEHDLTKGTSEAPQLPSRSDRNASILATGRASLVVDLTLQDLARLAEARAGWTAPLLRCALALLHPAPGTSAFDATCFPQWLDSIGGLNCPEPPRPLLYHVVGRLNARPIKAPSPLSVARSCRVTAGEATALGLAVVRPARRDQQGPLARRRATRMALGKIPRIVSIDTAQPWAEAGVSRSSWYKTERDPIERQVAAAEAIIRTGDPETVDDLQRRVAETRLQQHRHRAVGTSALKLVERLEALLGGDPAVGTGSSLATLVRFVSWGSTILEPESPA